MVKDMMPGRNAPPMHPNCRCSTAAYVDREALERELFGGNGEKDEDIKKPFKEDISKMTPAARAIAEEKNVEKQMELINKLLDNLGLPKTWWSGKIIIDEGLKSAGVFKRKSGDIVLRPDAPIKTRIHEALHARTTYGGNSGVDNFVNKGINEAVVELIAERICRLNGIEYIKTYIEPVKALDETIRLLEGNDGRLAMDLFETPFADRYAMLNSLVERAISSNQYSESETAMLVENMDILYGRP